MINKFFIQTDGGLGDNIRQYFVQHAWGTLLKFKENFPNCTIKVIARCTKEEGGEFFKEIPYIDEVETQITAAWWEMLPLKTEGYYNYKLLFDDGDTHYGNEWQELRIKASKIPYQQPKVYLNKEEQELFNEIRSSKYIFVHPFSGTTHRNPLLVKGCNKYMRIVFDTLIDTYGYKMVVVGGDYTNTTMVKDKIARGLPITEEYPYNRDGIINLVNKTNSRTSMALALNADRQIGTHSAFVTQACEAKEVKSILLVPNKFKAIHQAKFQRDIEPWVTALVNKNNMRIHWLDEETNFNILVQETIDWLK